MSKTPNAAIANPANIKALALDLDGTTLTPERTLSSRTVKALRNCLEKGLRIILATGRVVDSAEIFRAALGAKGAMIYCNGALVLDMPERRFLKTTLLGKEAAEFCVNLARETGVYFQMFFPDFSVNGGKNCGSEGGYYITESDTLQREKYYTLAGIKPRLGNLKTALLDPSIKGCAKAMFLAEPDVLRKVRPRLEAHFGKRANIAKTSPTFLEIMDAAASKGKGLEFIMQLYGLKKEEVIAFGDEENDLSMFSAAGFSCAPSSAKEFVKAAANVVISSNAEDGVAKFLEEFFCS